MNAPHVGILSMQRVPNYGSFLQAWALRRLLVDNGAADVGFIDIEKGRRLKECSASTASRYAGRAANLARSIFNGTFGEEMRMRRYNREVRSHFDNAFFPMLGLDRPGPGRYDLALIGSDEVFNCCQDAPWGFTTQLYGDVPQAARVSGYAGSFGSTTYERIASLGLAGEIKRAMSHMEHISVRDCNSADIVERLLDRRPDIHLDPVLIYDFAKETAALARPMAERYVVVYSYQGRITREEAGALRLYAKGSGRKLVSLMSHNEWCDLSVIPETPFHLFAWFRGADAAVTDTFHGTVLATVTHAPFATFVRESNRQKLGFLLGSLGLEGRAARTPLDMTRILAEEVSFDRADEIRRAERARSDAYLRRIMGTEGAR